MDKFHASIKRFNNVRDDYNMLLEYKLQPVEGALDTDLASASGDSGSAGFYLIDNELYMIGVVSYNINANWYVGPRQGMVSVTRRHKEWIDANLDPQTEKVPA